MYQFSKNGNNKLWLRFISLCISFTERKEVFPIKYTVLFSVIYVIEENNLYAKLKNILRCIHIMLPLTSEWAVWYSQLSQQEF